MDIQNKYNFIGDLINKPNLSVSQLKRILELTSKEIPEIESGESEISEKLNEIEERLNRLEEQEKEDKVNTNNFLNNRKKGNLPTYIDCSNTYKFLYAYNQNPILKTTCHLIDSNELNNIKEACGTSKYNFEKHYELIIQNFNEVNDSIYAPYRLKALIRGYLTGKDYYGNPKEWSSDNIKINWNCEELRNWCKNNIGVPPNLDEDIVEEMENIGFEFEPFKSKITQKRVDTFSRLIIHFKYLFHIRYDNSLKNIIENINKEKEWNNKIDFRINSKDFKENIELFTDVDKLIQAYEIIIKLILKVSKEKPIVQLSFKEDDNKNIIFSIHHINSVYRKTIQNTIERRGEDYTNLIKNQINGLCDFYLKAEFGCENCAEINLWDKQEKMTPINLPEFTGVEHILKFRK